MKTLITLLASFLIGISTIQAQWTGHTVPLNTGLIRYIDIINPNVIWAVGTGTTSSSYNPPILRTTDGGITWSAIPVNIPGLNGQFSLYSLEALDANTAFIVITLNNPGTASPTKIYKTTDAGLTWTGVSGVYTSQNSWINFVQFFDMNNGLAFGDNREIYTTNNGGNSWASVPQANLPAPSTFDGAVDRRTVLGNTIWVPVDGMRIYKSIDKGIHWTVSNTYIPATAPGFGPIVVGLAFQDANNGLASHGNNLSRTTDGGQTWTPVNYTGSFFIQGISQISGMPNTYVSFSGFNNNPGLSITTDNGLTWTLVDNNAHFSAAFISNKTGWSGGNEIMYKLSTNTLGTTKDVSAADSFFIYPNPGQGLFNITAASAGAFTLEVYDLKGRKVMQQQGNSFGKNTLDLSGHTKGIYLLHIVSGNQHLIEKVVLQ
jgi:photosystem II stability/assembly factor-like uncharacterized protein